MDNPRYEMFRRQLRELLGDRDIMFNFVKKRPALLKLASSILQQDRDFILKLVMEIDAVLHHAPATMKYDKEILLAAVARSSGTISDCFDSFEMGKDFEFLCQFASEIRLAIATHKSFHELLLGLASPTCHLSMLIQGFETDVALKKKIAEFAGIRFPMGPHLQPLVAAITNLEKFGF